MTSSFEKSVKGGTKIKLAPPKSKYVEHILLATHAGEAGVAEVFRTLKERLRDSTWTICFKSLIIVHLMIKEGDLDVTLRYLSASPDHRLAINAFTDVQTQGQNIRRYNGYLIARARGFADTHVDYVRSGHGRMSKISIDKGLLRETESVQAQIRALLKCDLLDTAENENEISLTAYRLLTKDLLDLFAVMNEAVMAILSHYFELSKPDAERSINIYKRFVKQTDQVVQYLSIARTYENVTRLEIPKIKHAPTSLVDSLQEYIDDNDFEVHRRQYLAEQQAKGKGGSRSLGAPKFADELKRSASPKPAERKASQPAASSAPMIDFFDTIEDKQPPASGPNPAQQYQQPQTTGLPQMYGQQTANAAMPQQASTNPFGAPQPQQQTNPFQQAQPMQTYQYQQPPPQAQPQPIQAQPTGFGFGGFGPQPEQQQVQPQMQPQQTGYNPFMQTGQQPQPQQQQQQQQPQLQMQAQPQIQIQQQPYMQPQQTASTMAPQPTGSNPFRKSMMPAMTGGLNGFSQPQQQSSNPFARPQSSSPALGEPTFAQKAGTQQFAQLQPQQTGSTNPFAKPQQPQQTGPAAFLAPSVTGSTNPFRQSAFVNQQTGRGWQTAGQNGTMGGWEQLETMPVFPRPGQ